MCNINLISIKKYHLYINYVKWINKRRIVMGYIINLSNTYFFAIISIKIKFKLKVLLLYYISLNLINSMNYINKK